MKTEERPWPKLPVTFRKKWTKALRSGEFSQAQGALYRKDQDGFCCLGLAAHLCGAEKMEMEGLYVVSHTDETCYKDIPKGFPTELVGVAQENKLVEQLAAMNDGRADLGIKEQNFKSIADWIDENLS